MTEIGYPTSHQRVGALGFRRNSFIFLGCSPARLESIQIWDASRDVMSGGSMYIKPETTIPFNGHLVNGNGVEARRPVYAPTIAKK